MLLDNARKFYSRITVAVPVMPVMKTTAFKATVARNNNLVK